MTPKEAQQAAAALVRRLIDERESRGLGVLELERDAGLSRSVIQDIEQGETLPRLTTLLRWAEALGWGVCFTRKAPEEGVKRPDFTGSPMEGPEA